MKTTTDHRPVQHDGPTFAHVVAFVIVFVSSVSANASGCPPISVTGDPSLAHDIAVALAEHRAPAQDVCSRVSAVVERRGPLLMITIVDGFGRRSEREVRDATTAAALIESWSLQQLESDRVDGGSLGAATMTTVDPITPGTTRRGQVSLGARSFQAFDGTLWFGGTLASCVQLRHLCAGGRFGVFTDSQLENPTNHDRLAVSLLATADLPVRAGGFTIEPGLGLGLGWTRAVQGMTRPTATGLRAAFHVAVVRDLTAHTSIVLDGVLEVVLVGGSGVFAGASIPPVSPSGDLGAGISVRRGW